MKQTLKIKAALIGAAGLVLFLVCIKAAASTPQPVDNQPLDGTPAPAILQAKETDRICSLVMVDCPAEQTEQARFDAISQMVSGTGFASESKTIADATKKYGVNVGLLIGIANAESSVGLHCKWNNCFGIMARGHELKAYDSLASGITDAARYLREKHHDKGRFTPEEIVNGYVGHPAPHWIINVNKYYLK